MFFIELEVGECSNQAIFLICQILTKLKKLSFVGSDMTYSGVVGLISRKSTLQELQIQNPRYLTKNSLKLMGRHMTLLKTLKYSVKINFF